MAARIEEILSRLMVPDNAVIQQATRELQAVYKDPGIVAALCEILLHSINPQIRQYAAVLLKKKLVKIWKRVPDNDKASIKDTLLQCLTQEQVHIVRHSIAHLISVVAKHEFTHSKWEELSQLIMQLWNGQDPKQKELSMMVIGSLMDTAALQLQPQFPVLFQLFSSALEYRENNIVPFYALKSLTAMVEYVGDDEMPPFRALIPKIMDVIKTLVCEDEDKACEAMELFDELVECDVAIVMPHLIPLIQFCLDLAANAQLGNNFRVKALSFVSWLVTLKKKALLRQGILPNVVRTTLRIMATPTEQEDNLLSEDRSESQSPITLAAQVLDVLALYLPPDKIFVPVLQSIEPWLQGGNEFERCAALMAVAVMTEGCCEYIRNNHLATLLQVVYKGVNDEHRIVQNAALFAIGQFSEHLQPEISQYSGDLLPVLFHLLQAAVSNPQQGSGVTKIFYALETFCEQLGNDLLPHLSVMMKNIFQALTHTNNIHIQELAISAIGAAANACQENLLPYFPRIIEVLKGFLAMSSSKELSVLQSQAVDTLGILAKTIGEDNFRPLAQECIVLGKNLMKCSDPDIRRSVYGMLASVSYVLKADMAPHLRDVVLTMLMSLVSEEGVQVHYAAHQVQFLDFEDEDEGVETGGNNDESIDDDDGVEGVTVENAYLEEKEDTCNALGELAENVGALFLPYIDDCYSQVNVLSEHSAEGIRKAAICALESFCKVWYHSVANSTDSNAEDVMNIQALVNSTLASFAATVRTDMDRGVVSTALEMLEDLLKFLRPFSFPLQERVTDSLVVSVQDVFEKKAECQREIDDDGLPGEDAMAEYDYVVVECAASVLGPLAGVVNGEVFLLKTAPVYSSLMTKLTSHNSTVAERSMAVGTFAEIVEGIGNHAQHMLQLYPVFMESLKDQEDEVCSNAVYGLGVLAANGTPSTDRLYPEILQSLFSVGQLRSGSRIKDNVCGAVCRMIMANQEAVPLQQVLPVVIENLPLKEDMEENATVYKCIVQLFGKKHPAMLANMGPMMGVFCTELSSSSKLSKELKLELVQLIHMLNSQCAELMQVAVASLTPEQLAVLNSALL